MPDSAFIKNEEGLYQVERAVGPREIIDIAATLLYEGLQYGPALTRPCDAAQFLQLRLATEKNEQFAVLFLDTRHRLIHFERLFMGTIDSASVHPRVVVQKALEVNAGAVIFAHNHPSNDCEPSQADRDITQKLKQALALIDVRVLDHLVVSRTDWTSLAERGWL